MAVCEQSEYLVFKDVGPAGQRVQLQRAYACLAYRVYLVCAASVKHQVQDCVYYKHRQLVLQAFALYNVACRLLAVAEVGESLEQRQ